MRPRLPPIFVVVLAGLVWLASGAPADAGIVRDSNASPSNPAVEAGGVHPKGHAAPTVPYSLIGALANEAQWRNSWQYCGWPLLNMPSSRRRAVQERMMFRSFNALPIRSINWVQ